MPQSLGERNIGSVVGGQAAAPTPDPLQQVLVGVALDIELPPQSETRFCTPHPYSVVQKVPPQDMGDFGVNQARRASRRPVFEPVQ